MGKIADVIGNSKPAVKNILLAKYGQYATDENGIIHMIIRDDYDVSEREDIHLSPTSNVKVLDDGKLYRVYRQNPQRTTQCQKSHRLYRMCLF